MMYEVAPEWTAGASSRWIFGDAGIWREHAAIDRRLLVLGKHGEKEDGELPANHGAEAAERSRVADGAVDDGAIAQRHEQKGNAA